MATAAAIAWLLLTVPVRAADRSRPDRVPPVPGVDADAIIRSSYNFLREREPYMTDGELAIYRQVMSMLKSEPEMALRLLEDKMWDTGSSAAFDLALGNVYYEQERFSEAVARYRDAVRKYPHFTRAWENLGILYFSTGRYAEAIPCFSRVATLGGLEARIFGLLGFCHAKTDNPAVAELSYMQACALEPDNPDWVEGLMKIILQTKQYTRAELLLRQLTRLRPKEGRHWQYLANVLLAEDRKLDAIVALDIAAGLDVLDADGLQLLGDLYVDAGLVPEAIRSYQQLAGRASGQGAGRMLGFARVLIESGDHEAAGELLAKAEPLLTPELRISFMKTRAAWLTAREEWEQAGALLESLLAVDPLNGGALLELAQIQARQGDDIRAVLTLESATRVPSVAFQACVRLAQIKVKLRQLDQALEALEKALKVREAPLVREYYAQIKALSAGLREDDPESE